MNNGEHFSEESIGKILAATSKIYYLAKPLIEIFLAYADLSQIQVNRNDAKFIFRAPVQDPNTYAFFEMRPSYVWDFGYELILYFGDPDYHTEIVHIFTGPLEKILAASGPGALGPSGINVDVKAQRVALPSPFGRWFFGFLERVAIIASDAKPEDVHPTQQFPDFPKGE